MWSMAKAPNGAVIKIANTATVNTILPQESPMERGMEPMAACTVAFGIYANMQKRRSRICNFVPNRQTNTPNIRNPITPKSRATAASPEANAYWMSTVAPTRTNSNNSAATQSLEYLADKRSATALRPLCSITPVLMTASNPENPIAPGIASSSVTYRKDRLKSRSTLRLSRRCIFRNSWDNRSPQRTPTAIPRSRNPYKVIRGDSTPAGQPRNGCK